MPATPNTEVLAADTSQFVPWRPRLALPRWSKVRIDDPGVPYSVELEIVPRDGRPVAVGVKLLERTGPVTSEGLRSVRLATYVDLAAQEAAWERVEDEGVITFRRAEPKATVVQGLTAHADWRWGSTAHLEVRPSTGRQLSDDHLREVAQIYKAALAGGSRAPRKAVVEHWRAVHGEAVASQTVASWLQKARGRGFLAQTEERKAGG